MMVMIKLTKSLRAWNTPEFEGIFKSEIELIEPCFLPLQAGLSQGSHVAEDEGFKVMLIKAQDDGEQIQAKIGIFYASIIAGCACSDDPTPLDICNEYCELQLIIDKITAEADIRLISD